MRVLAVDPGRQKCGLAVCDPEGVLGHRVVPLGEVAVAVRKWIRAYNVEIVVVGGSTGSAEVLSRVSQAGVPVRTVPEQGTTLGARRRYFQDHPPRGWRRFVPVSLQVPPEPVDDYSAILLAEAYLRDFTSDCEKDPDIFRIRRS